MLRDVRHCWGIKAEVTEKGQRAVGQRRGSIREITLYSKIR
jgi:hypothetical protein